MDFRELRCTISEIKNKLCFQATESKLHDLKSTEHSTKKTSDIKWPAAEWSSYCTCYYNLLYHLCCHASTSWSSAGGIAASCILRHLCEPSSFRNAPGLHPLHIFSLAHSEKNHVLQSWKWWFLQASDWVSSDYITMARPSFWVSATWLDELIREVDLCTWGEAYLFHFCLCSFVHSLKMSQTFFAHIAYTVDPLLYASGDALAYPSPKILVIKLAYGFRLPMPKKQHGTET